MESVGQRLKKLREQKNISLEEVYKATKIHIDILKDLEEDRFNRLSPVYIKSFLKKYTEFLGEDSETIVKSGDLEDTLKHQDTLKFKPPSEKKRRFIPLDIKQITNFRLPKIKLPKIRKKTLIFIISIIAIYILGSLLVKVIKNNNNKRASKHTEVKESKKSEEIMTPLSTEAVKSKTPSTKKDIPSTKIQPIQLGIQAKKNCWLKVVIDGKTVFQGTLKKKAVENWQADKLIELSIGDASSIELEVNGKIIPPLGRKGQTLKDIKITSEGITVGK